MSEIIIEGDKINDLDPESNISLINNFVGTDTAGKTVKIPGQDLINTLSGLPDGYLKSELPLTLEEGKALGMVYVKDAGDGVLAIMNELAIWKNAFTGGLIFGDPAPLAFYENTSPVAIASSSFAGESPENAFDTSKLLTGPYNGQGFIFGSGNNINQRIALDWGSEIDLYKMRFSNYWQGIDSYQNGWGVADLKVYTSVTAGDFLNSYDNTTGSMSLILDTTLSRHSALDEADWQLKELSNIPNKCRYFFFDCKNNVDGNGSLMGIRAIQLG